MIQGFKKDEPFFMYVAWSAVHGPLAVSVFAFIYGALLHYTFSFGERKKTAFLKSKSFFNNVKLNVGYIVPILIILMA